MKELKITPIRNGTVIDHIRPGMALKVIKYLGINGGSRNEVAIAMYTNSNKLGRKDLVKVEEMELGPREVNKLALLSPKATVSIIRDYKVTKKYQVQLPKKVEGISRCENLNCITNHKEPVKSKMIRISEDPPVYRCFYCGRNQEDITKNLI
ncbi:MAG: aspartate carbamoyltransferase regulatory subunit [Candidatus Thermoplasmatota archaeon]|nr:aspartate carbamoyltransferase regulatory subunit [Candidatus Thermoplasmatota archaeon]